MAMEEDKKDLLKVVQPTPKEISEQKETSKETQKSVFELPSGYIVAQEMRELFEEDIVTHVQGPSEPEAE
jgi:hypothetical protein